MKGMRKPVGHLRAKRPVGPKKKLVDVEAKERLVDVEIERVWVPKWEWFCIFLILLFLIMIVVSIVMISLHQRKNWLGSNVNHHEKQQKLG